MNEVSDKLRPYNAHGVFLTQQGNEAIGDCPFCDRQGKFSVNVVTGQWKCWSCAKVVAETGKPGGNVWSFLREFHALCFEATTSAQYRGLANDRKLLDTGCLIEWQLCKSITKGNWLIPGYTPEGQLVSLYQWVTEPDGHRVLKPTPTLGHHIHGMNLWDKEKPIVYICEGPWDAIALWEVLTQCKQTSEGLRQTASRESSLYAQANVIAVPGCEVFFEPWLPLFKDKIVNLMYDSDHPRKHPKTGAMSDGAGWRAMRRVTELFAKSKYPPQELNCVHWGPEGWDPSKKSGFDIRDALTA